MIQRLNPDIGYLSPGVFDDVGISQLVIAKDMAYWPGIIAAQSDSDGIRVSETDMSGQLGFVLDKLDAMLAAVGVARHSLPQALLEVQGCAVIPER